MLKAHNICYSHQKKIIIKPINISVNYGEMLVIVGPNGAGKSTLLSVLSNEIKKQEKQIFFKEKSFKIWNSKTLVKNKAKFSQQNHTDISLPVKYIVMMGRYPYYEVNPSKSDIEAVERAMKSMDILSLQNQNYNTLSGGEKQRVHLSRVLAQLDNEIAHKLIFLDEPLNHLDIAYQHRLLKMIKVFTKKGYTAILVLHDLNLAAQFADRVLLIKKGELIDYNTPEKVFTEDTLSLVYDYPCIVWENPKTQKPMITFGN